MHGLCYRMLGNADDAADVAQDCFVKAYYALATFQQDARFSAWLFGIANNACIDRLRKRARRPTDSLDQMMESGGEQASSDPTPEGVVMCRENERTIRDAVGRLPEKQRAMMTMFHFNRMSIKEISQALDRPVGTVKSDLHKAREALRRMLEGVVTNT